MFALDGMQPFDGARILAKKKRAPSLALADV